MDFNEMFGLVALFGCWTIVLVGWDFRLGPHFTFGPLVLVNAIDLLRYILAGNKTSCYIAAFGVAITGLCWLVCYRMDEEHERWVAEINKDLDKVKDNPEKTQSRALNRNCRMARIEGIEWLQKQNKIRGILREASQEIN